MQAPHFIELIGVPGSGKTTVSMLLRRELENGDIAALTFPEAGRTVARRSWLGRLLPATPSRWGDRVAWKVFESERLARGIWFLIRRPRLAVGLVVSQVRRPRRARKSRRVVHWWIRTAGARSLLLARLLEDEVAVLDEGLCHRVVQLFSSADEIPDRSVITRYASRIPIPDVLIHVVAPIDVSHDRVVSRGVWERLADEDPSRIRKHLDSASVAISYLLDSMDSQDTRIIEIQNAGKEPPSGDQILSLLKGGGALQ